MSSTPTKINMAKEYIPIRSFHLNDVEAKQADEFMEEHRKKCGAITTIERAFVETEETCVPTSSFQYCFTPSGLGPEIEIQCKFCFASEHLCDPDIED